MREANYMCWWIGSYQRSARGPRFHAAQLYKAKKRDPTVEERLAALLRSIFANNTWHTHVKAGVNVASEAE